MKKVMVVNYLKSHMICKELFKADDMMIALSVDASLNQFKNPSFIMTTIVQIGKK